MASQRQVNVHHHLSGAIRSSRGSLVVSDIDMPRMTGVELAAVTAARWPAVTVLLVSGQGGPPRSYEGRFLGKPFTPDELIATVDELLPRGAALQWICGVPGRLSALDIEGQVANFLPARQVESFPE
jgi:DNA-binding NtrC family response regulator